MRELSHFQTLRRFIVRKTFGAKHRMQFYESLRFLIENKQQLKPALQQMRDVWTDFGNKWHPFAELLDDCIDAVRVNSDENTLENTLARWLPYTEASVISAGIHSGRLPETLQYASVLTTSGDRILQALWQMSIYPLGLIAMLSGTLYVLNEQLIPLLAQISSPDQWTGALGFIYDVSLFITSYGVVCGILLSLLVFWVCWSFSRWHRPDKLRQAFDCVMPWSVYKDIQGATFLLNTGILLQSGVKLKDALTLLQDSASPWLAVRIEAVTERVREGKQLGVALKESGYAFPSREAANQLSMLQGDGTDEIIMNSGHRELEQTLKRLKRRATFIRLLMFFMLFGMLALMALLVLDISALYDTGGF